MRFIRVKSAADQAREHDRVFHATFSAARQARSRLVKVRPHRALTPMKVTRSLLAQAVILPILLCGVLFWAKPLLFDFWRSCILFWSSGLDLPFMLSGQLDESRQYTLSLLNGSDGAPLPGPVTLAATTVLVLLAFALSLRMKDARLPLKYPLRIVCVIQFVTLIYFWLTPWAFPYNIERHSEELMNIGYVGMLAMPVMLSLGYYILNQSVLMKLFHTALIFLFFVIMVPHQVLAQALVLQHLSVLFMPVLYICFGAVFDALVFVALYSWVVSDAPANATI